MKHAWTKLILGALILFLTLLGLRSGVPRGAAFIHRVFDVPIGWFGRAGRGISHGLTPFERGTVSEGEWNRLRKQVLEQAVLEARVQELTQLNQELQSLLRYTSRRSEAPVTARVMGFADDQFRRVLFIDRGSGDGVKLHAPVLAEEGVFFGRVIRVWEEVAAVAVAADTGSKIPGRVLGNPDAVGILEGQGVIYRMNLIPRSATITVGDTVVTERLGTTIPQNLAIGTVTAVEEQGGQSFKTALVEPLVSARDVSLVIVLEVPVIPL